MILGFLRERLQGACVGNCHSTIMGDKNRGTSIGFIMIYPKTAVWMDMSQGFVRLELLQLGGCIF